MPNDLLFQNLSSVQSNTQPWPPTIQSQSTISPKHAFTIVTGGASIANIVAPVSGYHQLTLMFTFVTPGAMVTDGNIGVAYTPIENRPITLHYDPGTNKYWPNAAP